MFDENNKRKAKIVFCPICDCATTIEDDKEECIWFCIGCKIKFKKIGEEYRIIKNE